MKKYVFPLILVLLLFLCLLPARASAEEVESGKMSEMRSKFK